jgi:hypothetical protein
MNASSDHLPLYTAPPLASEDEAVLGELQQMRTDLTELTSAGLLVPQGTGRGRHYIAGDPLRAIRDRRRAARKPLRDPYPRMRAKLAERTGPS